jgi:hypothetical protein
LKVPVLRCFGKPWTVIVDERAWTEIVLEERGQGVGEHGSLVNSEFYRFTFPHRDFLNMPLIDGFIVGLEYTDNGRTCKDHPDGCGEFVKVGDMVKFQWGHAVIAHKKTSLDKEKECMYTRLSMEP